MSEEVLRQVRIDLQLAGRLARASRWLAEALDDDHCRALSFKDAGHVHFLSGRYDQAVASYRFAVRLFTGAGAEVDAAIAINSSLLALSNLGRHEEAFGAAAAEINALRQI